MAYLEMIMLRILAFNIFHPQIEAVWHAESQEEQTAHIEKEEEEWIEVARTILLRIQLCNGLKKTLVVHNFDLQGIERWITLIPTATSAAL